MEEHLIPRVHGFEILMASYAMAHLKLDLLLKETGYKPKKQPRLNIYLTNSLEESHPDTGTLFATWLAQEANEANQIKRENPIMVVMGNPPYSVSSSNKGDWIQRLVADYKKDLNEKNIQPLSDDYIKFIRYGSHFIEKNGEGILAYISNNSFIDGVIHRQMRKHLLETFDKIYILDLHGNSKKKETAIDGSKDENVFDIMQGVSINIFVKIKPSPKDEGDVRPKSAKPINASVHHLDSYGLRKDKYRTLLDNSISTLPWHRIECRAPEYFFVAKDFSSFEEYGNSFSINDLFLVQTAGIVTHRDGIVIGFNKAELKNQVVNYLSETGDDNNFSTEKIKKITYRPFDNRVIYYDTNLVVRHRREQIKHSFYENYSLLLGRQTKNKQTNHFFITSALSEKKTAESSTGSNHFPLYLYPETTGQQSLQDGNSNPEQVSLFEKEGLGEINPPQPPFSKGGGKHAVQRLPNLNPAIVQHIAEKLGLSFTPEKAASADDHSFAPIDLLDYIYAVLHSPNYRETYKEFLKTDFPRVSYPDPQTFWQLIKLGGELRQLHLLDNSVVNKLITTYPVDGDNTVTRKINQHDFTVHPSTTEGSACGASSPRTAVLEQVDMTGKVWINDTQYFDGVPKIAWEFYIGGYQPAQKWLKDRHGRVLSFEDILHYQKIIVALTETHRIMQEIDAI